MVGPVDVGHGERERVAEHQAQRATCLGIWSRVLALNTLRVRRASMTTAMAVPPSCGRSGYPGRPPPRGRRVGDHRAEALGDRRERLVPVHLDQDAVAAHQRPTQSVRVAVELTETGALGADEPRAEHVVGTPRAAVMWATGLSSMVRDNPQVASQSGQMRSAVRVM
jgi:hypothetical protein